MSRRSEGPPDTVCLPREQMRETIPSPEGTSPIHIPHDTKGEVHHPHEYPRAIHHSYDPLRVIYFRRELPKEFRTILTTSSASRNSLNIEYLHPHETSRDFMSRGMGVLAPPYFPEPLPRERTGVLNPPFEVGRMLQHCEPQKAVYPSHQELRDTLLLIEAQGATYPYEEV